MEVRRNIFILLGNQETFKKLLEFEGQCYCNKPKPVYPPCSQQFVPETWSLDCIPLGFRSIPLILSWIQKQQPRPIRFWYSVPWYITMIVKPLFGSILLQLVPKVYSWWWLVTNENESISRSLPFWMAGSSHRFKTPWSFHQGGFLRTIKNLQNMLTNFQWNEFTWV